MIIELILNIIKSLLLLVLSAMPSLNNIVLPSGFMDWFSDVVSMSAYFIPVGDFLAMFGIWLLVTNFHLAWKIVQRVWDALPFT